MDIFLDLLIGCISNFIKFKCNLMFHQNQLKLYEIYNDLNLRYSI